MNLLLVAIATTLTLKSQSVQFVAFTATEHTVMHNGVLDPTLGDQAANMIFARKTDGSDATVSKDASTGQLDVRFVNDVQTKMYFVYDYRTDLASDMKLSKHRVDRLTAIPATCEAIAPPGSKCGDVADKVNGFKVVKLERFDKDGTLAYVDYLAPDLNYYSVKQVGMRNGQIIRQKDSTVTVGEPDKALFDLMPNTPRTTATIQLEQGHMARLSKIPDSTKAAIDRAQKRMDDANNQY